MNFFISAMNLQWKCKSFRLLQKGIIKTENEVWFCAHSGRKDYNYYKQFSFLIPTRPQQEGEASEGPAEEGTLVSEVLKTPPHSSFQKENNQLQKNSFSFKCWQKVLNESQQKLMIQTFSRCLLPHFKSIPETTKIQVQGEFINKLHRYKQHPPLASQQFLIQHPISFSAHLKSLLLPPCTSLPL